MGKLFCSDKVERFFELIQRPVFSQEEQEESARQAIACIAEEMHIGKVTVKVSLPQFKLRTKADNLTSVYYQGEKSFGEEPVSFEFATEDGGTIVFHYYPAEDYRWNEEELREIRIVCNQIYAVFSRGKMFMMLTHAMETDLMVEIPNVSGFMKFAGRIFAQGKLAQYCGIYLNIHNFKYVNKVLNYMQADEVMKLYAHTLKNMLEKDEIVSRLGGDNFVVLVRRENVDKFIKFVSNVDISYQHDGQEKQFNFGATVGVSYLDDLKNPGEIMVRISIAYQVARQHEGGGVVYYNDEIYKKVMRQKETIAGFEHALRNQEFVVFYQPKITTADKKICGAEALVRWKKDERIIPPVQFIPTLEKDGSICKLDFYVLDKVCAMLDKCRREEIPLTQISVNFSRKHIENPDLVEEIVTVIDKYHIPHEYLEIELTESEDFQDCIAMSKLINTLKEVDISTSIDDFGTGYSSLGMIKETNIELLKIDKSFIPLEKDDDEKKKDIIVFENITRLAKELGIKTIAEGVETKQQYEYLAETGCDMIQGYYFDKPLPEEEFLRRICIGHY